MYSLCPCSAYVCISLASWNINHIKRGDFQMIDFQMYVSQLFIIHNQKLETIYNGYTQQHHTYHITLCFQFVPTFSS